MQACECVHRGCVRGRQAPIDALMPARAPRVLCKLLSML